MAVTDPAAASALSRRTLVVESLLVLGVSLGASAVWSVLSIIRRLTAATALSGQTSSLNTSVTPDRPWLDLAYQVTRIVVALVPVALAVHLLARDGVSTRRLGLDRRRPWPDLAMGAGLAALVGIPGLGLYVVARAIGVNTTVAAAGLAPVWWAVPVLVLAAMQNAVLEETIMVGYLGTRWRQAGWSWWWVIGVSAVIRGAYHLYQGFGGFVGNIVMGVLFGAVYARKGRV
ncbi:CPBP family intramembrane glutamic endopeptidase, partial [Austwickia sp. TVS 96-490-7B]|uniref:CPBP family intramembrane glutamic endopeptidase n=1 Tax=Austwickia sp. TVS 96-490-7B TaxID=2830843 RepID=UPI001C59EB04